MEIGHVHHAAPPPQVEAPREARPEAAGHEQHVEASPAAAPAPPPPQPSRGQAFGGGTIQISPEARARAQSAGLIG